MLFNGSIVVVFGSVYQVERVDDVAQVGALFKERLFRHYYYYVLYQEVGPGSSMLSLECGPLGIQKTVNVLFYEKGDGNKIDGLPDDIAIVNAELIINPHHLLFAAMTTFTSIDTQKKLLCKTIAQEFIFNLSPSNNIADSTRLFGDQSGRIAIVDLGQRSADEFTSLCRDLVKRDEITDFQDILTNRETTLFNSVYSNSKSDEDCLSLVAVKALL